jgi:hypothetical protein
MTRTQIKDFNKTLYSLPHSADFASLSHSLSLMSNTTKNYLNYKKLGTLQPKYVLPPAENLLTMMKNYTVYTIALDSAQLETLCKGLAGTSCSHPKLLDEAYVVQPPIETPIPGTEAALKIK